MIYKPERISDVEGGAIVGAESPCERGIAAVGTLSEVAPEMPIETLGTELCGDEGSFAIELIAQLQACGVRTVITDPRARRRSLWRASEEHRSALRRASRAVRSKSGKALLRARGEHLEGGFCHLLDHGAQREATRRGCEKLSERHLCGAMSYNLSPLLRHLLGTGAPKQALEAARKTLRLIMAWVRAVLPMLASVSHGLALALRHRFPTSLSLIRLTSK